MSDQARFDLDAAARRINAENRAENEKAALRRESAVVEGHRLAAALREKDRGIRAIWGFGSTFEASRPYRMDSDIDLAIEGGDVIELLSITEDSDFDVDLVDISGMDDAFASAIKGNGKPL
jgi:predicted nucleotidyltransferase